MTPEVIVVSASARALVRSARRAGWCAAAIDAFGDVDTRAQAERWRRLPADGDGRIDSRALLAVLDAIAPEGTAVIIGSGLEAAPDAVDTIAARYELAGNGAAVWRRVGDARDWFDLLERLGIPHPEVRWSVPRDPAGWLCKRAASSGGRGVRTAADADRINTAGDGGYFQRRVEGLVASLLFLADGGQARCIGFNRLLAAPAAAANPFAWGGAVRPAALAPDLQAQVGDAATALTRALDLRGLNGLDFVVAGRAWHLLELNPRPTATVELWDVDPMPPLLDLHLRACRGAALDGPAIAAGGRAMAARALAVAYAPAALRVPRDPSWPDPCRDLPRPGSRLRAGDPLCTVHAAAATAAGAARRVLALRDAVPDALLRAAAGTARRAARRPAPAEAAA